jgi:hypothetical protein
VSKGRKKKRTEGGGNKKQFVKKSLFGKRVSKRKPYDKIKVELMEYRDIYGVFANQKAINSVLDRTFEPKTTVFYK